MEGDEKGKSEENTEKNESVGIPYREALGIVKSKFQPIGVEYVSLERSVGRTLAEDLMAKTSIPPFDIALVDGYALPSDLGETDFDENWFGRDITACWVNTGDRVPEGCDRVVKFEDAVVEGGKLVLKHKPKKWENVGRKGEDIMEGDPLLEMGTIIDEVKIASLKNCGIERLRVYIKPKVAVIATGDELGNKYEIQTSNDLMLACFLGKWGCEAKTLPVLRDSEDEIKDALLRLTSRSGTSGFDLILTTGGTSYGKRDLMRKIVNDIGYIHFHCTRIKPGRTAFFGEIYVNPRNSSIPIFCLPGTPPACLSAFMLYVKPAVLKMTGARERTFKATISERLPPSNDTRFVLLNFDGEMARPLRGGFFRNMLAANSYLILEEGDEVEKGEVFEIYPL